MNGVAAIEYALNPTDDPIFHRVAIANKDDEECSEICDAIAQGKEKLNEWHHPHKMLSGLYHKDRLWVPQQMYTDIITEIHEQPACGHPGVKRTYE